MLYKKGSNLYQLPSLIRTKSRNNCYGISNSLPDGCDYGTCFKEKNKGPHPFHVKSNWTPPIQSSIALESYLEHVKVAISEINIEKPKYNLSGNQYAAVKELKNNAAINLKRADKGSTTVILKKTDKIQESKVQLNNRDHYLPLKEPMVSQTLQRVNKKNN